MFEISGEELQKDVNRKQLAYNYQYAHPESSVLFFPTNTAITINHHSKAHNAVIRWSEKDKKSMYFLQRPLEELKKVRNFCFALPVSCLNPRFIFVHF